MTNNTTYKSPDLCAIEVALEQGFILSGVEAPDFENENDI